ncbi:hypothetical protein ABVK25_000227 [Lepraria finkii]|uniref:DUF6594 domain-containing protein n=1 Tax=Lepraria finkii TaxID=1340010 RepID=A0ABR4BMJ6_9LECA
MVMLMETCALADNSWQSNIPSDLNAYELYKNRVVRVDLAHRSGSRDILGYGLRKGLRAFWYFTRSGDIKYGRKASDLYTSASDLDSSLKFSHQNTARLAEVIARFLVALVAGAFLVVPIVILSNQSSSEAHLIPVSVCVIVFSFLVPLISMASIEQTMLALAAYAALPVVFLSTAQGHSIL